MIFPTLISLVQIQSEIAIKKEKQLDIALRLFSKQYPEFETFEFKQSFSKNGKVKYTIKCVQSETAQWIQVCEFDSYDSKPKYSVKNIEQMKVSKMQNQKANI